MSLSKTPQEYLRQKLLLRRSKPLLVFSALLITIGLIGWFVFVVVKPYVTLAWDNGLTPQFVWSLVTAKTLPIRQTAGRTNILVLGIPGGNHEGPDLTDAMLVVSIEQKNPATSAFIPLPRDIWSPTLKDKINSAYHYGEARKRGGGLILAKAIAREVTNLPIDYAVTIDFSEFIKTVDIIGGIDVTIDRAFDDFDFPIAGREDDLCSGDREYRCRYKHIHFDAGIEHMNGERALEYVRSRHAGDEEGTDYARSKRQEAVLTAIKKKLATKDVVLDIDKIRKLLALYNQAIDSDLFLSDLVYLAKLMHRIDPTVFTRITIPAEAKTRKKDDLLIVAPIWQYQGRWVLVPRSENFSEIHNYIDCKLNGENCAANNL